jgi:acetylornithine deacetylase/succinyl-diaminopimelate desuccinylase-like protein
MDRAAELMAAWCREQLIAGLKVEILREKGRTPVLLCEIPGTGSDTVLLYGHMDKQPEFTGWAEGLSPWEPVIRDGKLYGRGGADDGYAVFSSLTAIRLLQEQKIPHARCVVLIEACEESGSYDLPFYVDKLADASERRVSSSASTPNAATTTSSGARRRCGETSSGTSSSRA